MKTIEQLVNQIIHDKDCSFEKRSSEVELDFRGQPFDWTAGKKLPDDMRYFYGKLKSATLLPGKLNGWEIIANPFHTPLAEGFMPEEDIAVYDFHRMTFCIALYDSDNMARIAVSLNENSFGKLFYHYVEFPCLPNNCPIIAESFSDWLNYTFSADNNSDSFYWDEPQFRSLGVIAL